MLCRWACQPTMAATYHRVQETVRWLDEPVALRSENGRKTTGTAEEIAAQVALLASPRAAFTTGTNVVIDGGLTKRIQY